MYPDDVSLRLQRSRVLSKLGRSEQAAKDLGQGRRAEAERPVDRARVRKGLRYARSGRKVEADFAKAVAMAPNDSRFRIALGQAHIQLGQFDKAEADFAKAAALAPNDPQVFIDGGW
jgi:Flp pilus assembly protein TadD